MTASGQKRIFSELSIVLFYMGWHRLWKQILAMSVVKQIALLLILLSLGTFLGTTLVSFSLSRYLALTNTAYNFDLNELWEGPMFFSVFTIPISCFFGVPAFFALKRVRLLNWQSLCLVGTLLGALFGATTFVSGVPWIACVGMGLFSSLITWWLIVHSKIPLKQVMPSAHTLT